MATSSVDISEQVLNASEIGRYNPEAVEILEQILKEFPNNDTAKNLIKKISQI